MTDIRYTFEYASPIGVLMLASDGDNITGLWMKEQKYFASTLGKNAGEKKLPVFIEAKNWLDSYFNGENPSMTLPLRPEGSGFRQAVWDMLCAIPYGSVVTYGDIAKAMAAKAGLSTMSAQAVGGAVGHNPISIFIPCHRVVGTNGSLTGYAGGIDKKILLLNLEGIDTTKFTVPLKGTAL